MRGFFVSMRKYLWIALCILGYLFVQGFNQELLWHIELVQG